MSALILFGLFFLLLILNVPIAVSLGISSVVTLLALDLPFSMIPVNFYAGSSKIVLLAIPFFILGGNIMGKSGISTKLVNFAQSLVGHIRGGLAMIVVLTTCFFAAISGSGPATVAALGILLIPAMAEVGYKRSDSTALVSVSGVIGLIIPPSILFVIYGSITGVSVTNLFMAGVIPGLFMGFFLIVTNMILNRNRPLKKLPKATSLERWLAFKDAFWGLMMPVIILGGIYGGIFTATEAAAVSAVYGLLVGVFIYKSITIPKFFEILTDSVKQTAAVMFITATASLFAWVITVEGIAEIATNTLLNVSDGNLLILMFMINIILLIAGMFLDGASSCYIIVPIIATAATSLGFDPVALGVITVMNLAIGNATPPVGVCLYVGCSIGKVSLKEISYSAAPYIIASILALITVTIFPQIATILIK